MTSPCCPAQVAGLEAALTQAQAKLSEHSNSITVRATRAEEDRWRWQSEAEELRGLLSGRDRDIGKLQSKQEVRYSFAAYLHACGVLR